MNVANVSHFAELLLKQHTGVGRGPTPKKSIKSSVFYLFFVKRTDSNGSTTDPNERKRNSMMMIMYQKKTRKRVHRLTYSKSPLGCTDDDPEDTDILQCCTEDPRRACSRAEQTNSCQVSKGRTHEIESYCPVLVRRRAKLSEKYFSNPAVFST